MKALRAAGGIGITLFLSMLRALVVRGADAKTDVVLALPTREPAIMLRLLRSALGDAPLPGVRIRIEIFTSAEVSALENIVTSYGPGVTVA